MGAFDHLKGTVDRAGNPFSDQPGVPPPALVGRDRHLRRLLSMIEAVRSGHNAGSVFLPGPRGLGKTSLLVATGRESTEQGLAVARAELADDPAEAAALVVAALAEAVGRSGLADLARRVTGVTVGPVGIELADPVERGPASLTQLALEAIRACHDHGGLLLLLDEAQEHPATAAALVRASHRAAQDGLAVGLVLAGLPGMQAAIVAEVSYAERIDAVGLGPLSTDDAFAAIAVPLADAGVTLSTDHRGHVATVTGGYPYFVQVLGREVWRALDDDDRVSPGAFSRAARAAAQRTDQWLADRVARLADSQRDYLEAGSRVGWPARTGAIAAELGRPPSSLSPVRAALLADGLLLVPTRGVVDLVVPPLAGWLQRQAGT